MQNWEGLAWRENDDGSVSFRKDGKVVMTMSRESFILQVGLLPNPLPKALASKAALLALVATSCACAREPPINVNVQGQPEWVVDAFEKAADFWALHDIEVNVVRTEIDSVAVQIVSPSEIDGDLARWSPSNDAIKVSENLGDIEDPRNADLPSCSIAHEIGHALGMDHVEDRKSLMAPKATQLPLEGGCWWSVDDQIELCRATGCIDEETEGDEV